MVNETKCPECGTLMTGYCDGDICSDCYELNCVADDVLDHIDTMYSKMWNVVAKTARMSIRNTIKSRIRETYI